MKKLFLISLSLLLCFTISQAENYTDENGVTWTYSVNDGNAFIDGVEGYSENVIVPNSILGMPVTRINRTFRNNTTIKNVTIPTSVTVIMSQAFEGCTRLLHVEGLSNCSTISNDAFSNCSSLKTVDLAECTSISNSAFYGCNQLANIGNLSKCLSIGTNAFRNCYKLVSVGSLESLQTVGASAFYDCDLLVATINLDLLTSVQNYAFSNCRKLSFEGSFSNCSSIGTYAFSECSNFSDVKIHSNTLSSIGDYAFQGSVKNIDIKAPNLVSIGRNAFTGALIFSINTTTPPSLGAYVFNSNTIISVPDALVNSYKVADGWSTYASRIFSDVTKIDYDIDVEALSNSSAVHATIGEANLDNVVSLKVTGTINSYDVMIIRNKMPNLHSINLSNARIVANDYEYYQGCKTTDDVIGDYFFYGMGNLLSIKLPNTITAIGHDAFRACGGLTSIDLPEGLVSIGDQAFWSCSNIKIINFPSTLKYIGPSNFVGTKITTLVFPPSLKQIGYYCFGSCGQLREVRIPSSITSIGSRAFENCTGITDVYTYTIEPTSISQETFAGCVFANITLHVPNTSYYNYYWNTQWSRFTMLSEFDEPYEYFYLNHDYTLDDNNGRIDGEPDADLNPGSGLIVEGNEDQDLDDVNVIDDGTSSGSIIGDGNIDANNLYIEKTIKKNQWYFFCFPYRIRIADIQCEGNWVFRWYDGEERANNGYGGWKHMPIAQEYLEPNQGYIFRCDRNTTLLIPVQKAQYGKFSGNDEQIALNHYPSSNAEDASWNFMGQPYPCYYDIDESNFDGPITVWNGTSYETVRPGDDEYHLSPFEGYFVQKPVGQSTMEFDSDGRHTYQQWDGIVAQKQQAPRRSPAETGRYLVNLTLTDGVTTDKTRVVYNEKCTADYEIGTDAAKFMSDGVAQLYSLDSKQVRYSINERPMGEVSLGYVAPNAGTMTISGKRMDADVMLRDNQTGETFDLSNGEYTFTTEAGTFEQRFTLLLANGATGIKTAKAEGEQSPIYTVDGKRVTETKANQLYIKEGKKLINK